MHSALAQRHPPQFFLTFHTVPGQMPRRKGSEGKRAPAFERQPRFSFFFFFWRRRKPTFARDAIRGTPAENHPLEKHVIADVFLSPRSGQPARFTALLLAQAILVEDLAATVSGLPEPAIPSCARKRERERRRGRERETQPYQCQLQVTQTQHVRLSLTFTRLFTFKKKKLSRFIT